MLGSSAPSAPGLTAKSAKGVKPMVPTEITIKASALSPDIHEGLTEGRRFNFRLAEGQHGAAGRFFTARAEQAPEPGFIRIFDIRDERRFG